VTGFTVVCRTPKLGASWWCGGQQIDEQGVLRNRPGPQAATEKVITLYGPRLGATLQPGSKFTWMAQQVLAKQWSAGSGSGWAGVQSSPERSKALGLRSHCSVLRGLLGQQGILRDWPGAQAAQEGMTGHLATSHEFHRTWVLGLPFTIYRNLTRTPPASYLIRKFAGRRMAQFTGVTMAMICS
jgi:hypothetical protein